MQIANMGGYSKASTELKDELAKAQAERYNAAKKFYDDTRRMESELNTFRKEIEAERKRKAEERKRKEEERLAYIKSLNDEIKALEREHLSELDKLKLDSLELEQWRIEEKKKHPKQIALIEKLYLKKSDKLKEEYNKKEKERLLELEQIQLEHFDKLKQWAVEAYNKLSQKTQWEEENELNELIIQGVKNTEAEKLRIRKEYATKERELFEDAKSVLIAGGMTEEEYSNKLIKLKADEAVAVQASNSFQIQSEKAIKEARKQSAMEMVGNFAALGSAIAQNIQDEKQRMRVEAAIALAQALVNQGIAIAEVINDPGDPYLKAFRIVANVSAIVAAMATATEAFNKASAAIPYAEGTDYHKGGAALIGEAGEPEIVMIKNREPFIIDKPTLIKDFPVGAKVIPMHKADNVMSMTETNELLKAIKNKPTVNVNVSDEITTYIQSKLNLTKVIGGYFKV